jgi:PAS domain S-box-containing protein
MQKMDSKRELPQGMEALNRRIRDLERTEAAHAHLEEELGKRTGQLEQRVREVNCLYEVSRLMGEKNTSLDEIFHSTVHILLSALESPGGRTVRITVGDRLFATKCLPGLSAKLSRDLLVHGSQIGVLEVCHDRHDLHEGEEHLIAGVQGLLERLIEQKQTEKALRESEKRFRALVENSPTGIFIVQDGRIIYENPEEMRLFGPLSQLFRDGDLSSIHPEDAAKVKSSLKTFMLGQTRTMDIDFRFFVHGSQEGDSEMRWVHCRATLIEYLGKEAILVNKLDVTRAKELEHLLGMEDKMASLGRVTSGIAHEIRNPLSGINIYLSNLEKVIDSGGSVEKAKEIMSQLQSASNRIESVIKRVMDFSRPNEPRLACSDMNHLISNALDLSRVTLRKAGITLDTSLAPDLAPCDMDPNLMGQVILNLVTNAAEAMKGMTEGKKIKVTSFGHDDRIVVRISDSGPGVPRHLRRKIFDPFYTTKSGNSGIGLNLCSRIVTDHGGSLGVLDGELGGAEFRIEIPVRRRSG